jgi:hypothetical protein
MAESHDEERQDAGSLPARRPHRSLLMLDRSRHDTAKRPVQFSDHDHRPSVDRANRRKPSNPDDEMVDKMEFLGDWLQRAHAYSAHVDENPRSAPSATQCFFKLRSDLKRKAPGCRRLSIPPTIMERTPSCESLTQPEC